VSRHGGNRNAAVSPLAMRACLIVAALHRRAEPHASSAGSPTSAYQHSAATLTATANGGATLAGFLAGILGR